MASTNPYQPPQRGDISPSQTGAFFVLALFFGIQVKVFVALVIFLPEYGLALGVDFVFLCWWVAAWSKAMILRPISQRPFTLAETWVGLTVCGMIHCLTWLA
ncbi:MAG: hypothetical protein NXI32_20100 [bacterium]|nr:hypothetical protein [bacterium]